MELRLKHYLWLLKKSQLPQLTTNALQETAPKKSGLIATSKTVLQFWVLNSLNQIFVSSFLENNHKSAGSSLFVHCYVYTGCPLNKLSTFKYEYLEEYFA